MTRIQSHPNIFASQQTARLTAAATVAAFDHQVAVATSSFAAAAFNSILASVVA